MLCNADDAMIRILVTVTSGMLQSFPLKEISSPRFKALGYVMEKEICQNSFIFNFLIKQEAGENHSIKKHICTQSTRLWLLFSFTRVHSLFLRCCREEKHGIRENSPADSLQIPRWLPLQSVGSTVFCTTW